MIYYVKSAGRLRPSSRAPTASKVKGPPKSCQLLACGEQHGSQREDGVPRSRGRNRSVPVVCCRAGFARVSHHSYRRNVRANPNPNPESREDSLQTKPPMRGSVLSRAKI